MKREALPPHRLEELWAAFDPAAVGWQGWLDHYVADLTWVHEQDTAALRSEAGQRRLWKLTGLGTAGPSENLNVDPLLTDLEFIDKLLHVRRYKYDPAPSRRAADLQADVQPLERDGRDKVPGRFPVARFHRALHGLRPGDFLCAYSEESRFVVRDFMGIKRGTGAVATHVAARARLRTVLGQEADLAEHARRSIFCWWLYVHAEVVSAGEMPPTAASTPPDEQVPEEAELLEIPSPERQGHWFQNFRNGLTVFRLVLRECLEPQREEDIVALLLEDSGGGMSRRYVLAILRTLRRLGMLELLGDRIRTTDAGESFLDDSGNGALIEALLIRHAGMAWALRSIQNEPGKSADLHARLAPFAADGSNTSFGRWLLTWGSTVGLFERQRGGTWVVTELGRDWLRRIPAELPVPQPTKGGTNDDEVDDEPPPDESKPHPDLTDLLAHFDTLREAEGLVFTPAQIRALHAGWTLADHLPPSKPKKRFVILSGLSGTGKTQLLLRYAEMVCTHMGLDAKQHLALVPVRPDWRDPTGLLGYLNALHSEPTFQQEPALRLVRQASKNQHLPYFLVLDEMNLAPVERYFAPFLSAMETGKNLHLHAHDEAVGGIPRSIAWPGNLRIGGTVNMDETTHAFSDKVLDRAFTFELYEVHLDRFFATRAPTGTTDEAVQAALTTFQAHLRPIRRHVGYRTLGEVLSWVATAKLADPSANVAELIDHALLAKVLPRLRGAESEPLEAALDALLSTAKSAGFVRCHDKLTTMRQRLSDTGVTGFWS